MSSAVQLVRFEFMVLYFLMANVVERTQKCNDAKKKGSQLDLKINSVPKLVEKAKKLQNHMSVVGTNSC